MGPFEVHYTESARVDVVRLCEFLLDRVNILAIRHQREDDYH